MTAVRQTRQSLDTENTVRLLGAHCQSLYIHQGKNAQFLVMALLR